MSKTDKTQSNTMGEALRLHWWAAKVWWKVEPKLFITTALHAIVSALSPFVTIWISVRLIEELAGNRNPETLGWLAVLAVLSAAALNLLTASLKHWMEAVHGAEDYQEDRLTLKKLLDMDFAAVDAPKTTQIRYAIRRHQMGNVYGFEKIHHWYLDMFVKGLASIVGAITLTVSLFTSKIPSSAGAISILNHPLSSVVLLLVLLFGVVLGPLLSVKGDSYFSEMWPYVNRGNISLNILFQLCNMREHALDIRMYNQHIPAEEAWRKNYTWKKGSPAIKIRMGKIAPFSAASASVSAVMTGVIYVFVCLKAWAGAFGIGAVTQYVGAVTRLCSGFTDLFNIVGDMRTNTDMLRDIRSYLEIPNDMYQGSLTTEKRTDRQYDVEFRDVSFKYPGSETYALRHVNIKFKVGNRLAVVGENGSGKTTFIKLLCRLYDPTEGQILLNDIDIRKYNYKDYMDIFSVVFQDFKLAALSLGENVAASADYDPERVKDSLIKAGFGERLKEMPDGLNTYLYRELEETGVEVSGGEAQKIAIARALYKDAPFIILDEPTAALDPMAEAEIYGQFNEISGDRTAIYISHRLSSCKFCDEIMVFHEGAVVQQGTHDRLAADETGKYHELWNAQAQYYTDK